MTRATQEREPTHRLEGFELRSVGRIALFYYACALAVLMLGVVLTWAGLSALGFVGQFEEFMRSIGFRGFRVSTSAVILGGILLVAAVVVFLTVMTMLAAGFYNALARHHGVGVRLKAIPTSKPTARDGRRPIRRRRHIDDDRIVNGTRHNRPSTQDLTAVSWNSSGPPASHHR